MKVESGVEGLAVAPPPKDDAPASKADSAASTRPRWLLGADERRAMGRRIAMARQASGLSKGVLADRIGVRLWTIDRIERAAIAPSPDQLTRIAEATGRTLAWLTGQPENAAPPVVRAPLASAPARTPEPLRLVEPATGASTSGPSETAPPAADSVALRAQRDRFARECDRLTAECERLAAERDSLLLERERLAAERDGQTAVHDRLTTQLESLAAERDVLAEALVSARARAIARQEKRAGLEDDLAIREAALAAGHAALDQRARELDQLAADQAEIAQALIRQEIRLEARSVLNGV